MSQAATGSPRRNAGQAFIQNATVTTVNSTDAFAMIEHGGALDLHITTPVGSQYHCSTVLIGKHGTRCLLLEVPDIPADDFNYFFQDGFWINVRAISPRGEGAELHFRSQLLHQVKDPLPMLLLSVPTSVKVTQLRKEPRFEVKLPGKVILESHKSDCELRDLSKSGCRFVTPPLGRTFQLGDQLTLSIFANSQKTQVFAPLQGSVCNLQRSLHYALYGLKFDEEGANAARALLNRLKFNGSKLTLPA
ncbi:flagellar brake protein [Gallaecimonas pentaromativorans]|uniref:flagellar brake protein n=1 Tax=Gallaecimonas pentaromativorans TaxID=584787 RepID=UPI003A945D8C